MCLWRFRACACGDLTFRLVFVQGCVLGCGGPTDGRPMSKAYRWKYLASLRRLRTHARGGWVGGCQRAQRSGKCSAQHIWKRFCAFESVSCTGRVHVPLDCAQSAVGCMCHRIVCKAQLAMPGISGSIYAPQTKLHGKRGIRVHPQHVWCRCCALSTLHACLHTVNCKLNEQL